ncbi:MAG: hypothetical protein WDN24_21730 [Sphingomonas sp.]
MTFDVDSGDAAQPSEKAKAKARERTSGTAKLRPRQPEPPSAPPPPVELPKTKVAANVLWMTRREYLGTDLGKQKPAADASTPGERDGGRPDSAVAGGRGPHGETLYAAEWHVRPTQAQLATYIPQRLRQDGWGLIACRTVANYRVEDCPGAGRFAARIGAGGRGAPGRLAVSRPPAAGRRREMVGAWVSIRIDYEIAPAK